MPINFTVTNSGKVFIVKILVFKLAASRLNSKVCLSSLGMSRTIYAAHTKNSKLNNYNIKRRLSAIQTRKKDVFFYYAGDRIGQSDSASMEMNAYAKGRSPKLFRTLSLSLKV